MWALVVCFLVVDALPVLVNMSSRGFGQDSESLAPVQYIHIPKAAGTTIQSSLYQKVRTIKAKVHVQNSMGEGCDVKKQTLVNGEYYTGHSPIGFIATNWRSMNPVYILCHREPLSLAISLYDYKASHAETPNFPKKFTDLAKNLVERERQLKVNGDVASETGYLDFLLRHGDQDNIPYSIKFFIPCGCDLQKPSMTSFDLNNYTLSGIHNILRIDVIAVTEDFPSLLTQLDFHLPWFRPFTMLPTENTAARPKQIISNETKDIIQRLPHFQRQKLFYDITKLLAAARGRFATECLAREARGLPQCDGSSSPVDLPDDIVRALDESKDFLRSSSCLVPPPSGTEWPRFFTSS